MEFTKGIEIMRQEALNIIKDADDLEHAAYMITELAFFYTPEGKE